MDSLGQARSIARMERVDGMDPEMKMLVHEYGLTVIQSFLDLKVTKARQIEHLIKVVLRGSTEIGDRTNSPKLSTMKVYIPVEPTERMVLASMAEVSNFDMKVTKYEKHRIRLKAAIQAGRM